MLLVFYCNTKLNKKGDSGRQSSKTLDVGKTQIQTMATDHDEFTASTGWLVLEEEIWGEIVTFVWGGNEDIVEGWRKRLDSICEVYKMCETYRCTHYT